MGRSLGGLMAAAEDLESVGGIATEGAMEVSGYPHIVSLDGAANVIEAADVVLDFSTPQALRSLLEGHAGRLAGKAIITGTTGLDDAAQRALEGLASRAAVLSAANFSIGVNLLAGLARRAGAVLTSADYDVEIVEAHHGGKVDAPSGTALTLGRAVAEGRSVALADVRRDGRSGHTGARPAGEIGLHSLRGGSVVGEHRIHFLGRSERIELSHTATDRALFAEGALTAARWMAGRPAGRYDMDQVLGLV
jgi:4-hydroxy-tetrahydrodipicolinate reductase